MELLFWMVFTALLVKCLCGRAVKVAQLLAGAARGKNRSRCQFCGSRLNGQANGLGFADHCACCGRAQPWAMSRAGART